MTATSSGYVDFLLSQLECAALRGRLIVTEIDSISTALRGGLVDPDIAMQWMSDIGALGLITAVSSVMISTSAAT